MSTLSALRTVYPILGRRETMRLGMIALGAAMVYPLTGCSPSEKALGEWAAGTWDVTCPAKERWSSCQFTVDKDGTWSGKIATQDGDEAPTGTWALSGGLLSVHEDGDDPFLLNTLHDDEGGTASTVPDKVSDDDMPSSVTWNYGSETSMNVPITWDADSKTLTLTGVDGNENAMPISAVKQD